MIIAPVANWWLNKQSLKNGVLMRSADRAFWAPICCSIVRWLLACLSMSCEQDVPGNSLGSCIGSEDAWNVLDMIRMVQSCNSATHAAQSSIVTSLAFAQLVGRSHSLSQSPGEWLNDAFIFPGSCCLWQQTKALLGKLAGKLSNSSAFAQLRTLERCAA